MKLFREKGMKKDGTLMWEYGDILIPAGKKWLVFSEDGKAIIDTISLKNLTGYKELPHGGFQYEDEDEEAIYEVYPVELPKDVLKNMISVLSKNC